MSRCVGLAVLLALAGACGERSQSELVVGRSRLYPETVDFQRVAVFDTKNLTVEVRNLGRGSLRILAAWVDSPEGVYAVQQSGEGPAISPGENYPLTVSFTPRAEGTREATLWVRTDEANDSLMQLTLTGLGVRVRADLPLRILDFGRIEAQASKSVELPLTNPSDMPVEVTATVVGADRDEFKPGTARLEPGETKALSVLFLPERVGRKQAALSVAPCRGCPEEPVAIRAEALDRALVADPVELDFGQVPVDRELFQPLRLRNISTEVVAVASMTLDASSDPSFTAPPASMPVLIMPESTQDFDHRYAPSHIGDAVGSTTFRVISRRNPTLTVPLRGIGGAAELCVSPVRFDFGTQPVGSRTAVTVTVRNCGSSSSEPLTVNSFTFASGDATEYDVGPLSFPVTLVAGQEVRFQVFYEPLRDGPSAVNYTLSTSAVGGTVAMRFAGTARTFPPCNLEVKPSPRVDFGTLPPGQGAVLGVRVKNLGEDVCAVKNIRVTDDAGGVYFMPGNPIDGLLLDPGDYFSFQIAARGQTTVGSYLGRLELAPNGVPVRGLDLVLNVQNACLVATPPFVDFGLGRPECPLPTRQVNFRNMCGAPVSVSGVFIGPGTTDTFDAFGPEFRLEPDPAPFPPSVAPGASFNVGVRYLSQMPGMNLSPLFVNEVGLARPLMVPLLGETTSTRERIDYFVQQDGRLVDILFVVDNTESMTEESAKLQEALPAFAAAAVDRGVDFHIGVTTTGIDPISPACPGGANGGEAGRLYPVDNSIPRLITPATPSLATSLQVHALVGRCAEIEQGFEAVRLGLSEPLRTRPMAPPPYDGNAGFLRDAAGLTVVFISDEDDHSPDDVSAYAQFLRTLKGAQQPQRSVAFAIAPTPSCTTQVGGTGDRYAQLTSQLGGAVLPSCSSAAEYASFLQGIASQSFSPQDRFPLSGRPEGGVVTVRVDGQPRATGWTYDEGTNSVVFSPIPAPGAYIEVRYRRACN